MPSNKNIGPGIPTPRATTPDSGFPFDRPAQVRPGVRYRQSDFPGNGKFSVPSTGDKAARGGQIQDYESMGKVPETRAWKNLKGGR